MNPTPDEYDLNLAPAKLQIIYAGLPYSYIRATAYSSLLQRARDLVKAWEAWEAAVIINGADAIDRAGNLTVAIPGEQADTLHILQEQRNRLEAELKCLLEDGELLQPDTTDYRPPTTD